MADCWNDLTLADDYESRKNKYILYGNIRCMQRFTLMFMHILFIMALFIGRDKSIKQS